MSRTEISAPTEADDEKVARATLMDQCRVASAGLNAATGTTMPEDAVAALRDLGSPANG